MTNIERLKLAQQKLIRASNVGAGALSAEDAANEAIQLASEAEWLVSQAIGALSVASRSASAEAFDLGKSVAEFKASHDPYSSAVASRSVESEDLWRLLFDVDRALQAHHSAHLCAWQDETCPACEQFGGIELFRRLRDSKRALKALSGSGSGVSERRIDEQE